MKLPALMNFCKCTFEFRNRTPSLSGTFAKVLQDSPTGSNIHFIRASLWIFTQQECIKCIMFHCWKSIKAKGAAALKFFQVCYFHACVRKNSERFMGFHSPFCHCKKSKIFWGGTMSFEMTYRIKQQSTHFVISKSRSLI